MLRRSHASSAGASFFYVMMAGGCFQRALATRAPKVGGALREMGRGYLAKAKGLAAMRETPLLQSRRIATP